MGLKSKLNKMKSFLFDEEEEEIKKPKKNIVKIEKDEYEENDDEFSKTQELSFDDDISFDESKDIKSRSEKKEKEFNFPEFDDDDFMVSKSMHEEIKPIVKEEPKRVLYQGSKRKEETKRFKPSPIISPIYGLLDKEGNTMTKDEKEKEYSKVSNADVTYDDVRKKAYGSLENELENTLKRLSKKTIEEAEKDMEEEEKYASEEIKVLSNEIEANSYDEDDDDMILPNINFKEIDVDKERIKDKKEEKKDIEEPSYNHEDEDDDEDTKEQDLFNLIDSMYQKGDE